MKLNNIEGQKIAIHVLTPKDVKECDNFLKHTHHYLYDKLVYKNGDQCINANDRTHSSLEYFRMSGYTIITAEDFLSANGTSYFTLNYMIL